MTKAIRGFRGNQRIRKLVLLVSFSICSGLACYTQDVCATLCILFDILGEYEWDGCRAIQSLSSSNFWQSTPRSHKKWKVQRLRNCLDAMYAVREIQRARAVTSNMRKRFASLITRPRKPNRISSSQMSKVIIWNAKAEVGTKLADYLTTTLLMTSSQSLAVWWQHEHIQFLCFEMSN